MTVEWRHNNRIIFISSGDGWTWDDAHLFLARLREMLQTAPDPVQVIIQFRPEFRLPPGGFTDYMRQTMQIYQEQNVQRVYYVGSPDILTLMQAAIQRSNTDVSRHVMLNSLDEAMQYALSNINNNDTSC